MEQLDADICDHRITLNTPLTPFTVLFCHIISRQADCADDLHLLKRFIRSLQYSRNVSEGADKFYQLCSVFWKVAEAYVQVKDTETRNMQLTGQEMDPDTQQPNIDDFDEYLTALGLAPQPFYANATTLPDSELPLDNDMSAYLQDWYSGNASLYGLLEQDLSNIM